MRSRLLVPALVCVLAAACGTTVRQSGQEGVASSTAGGLGDTSASGATNGTSSGGGLPGSTGTGGGSTGAGSSGGSGSGSSGMSGSGPAGGSGGPGGGGSTGATGGGAGLVPTTGPIKVGVVYLKGLDAAYAAIGSSSKSSDSKAQYATVFDALNKQGGVNGRKLVASYFAIDAASTQSQGTQAQAACQQFAQDTPVSVVLSYTAGDSGGLAHCLGLKGIPLINGYPLAGYGESTFSSTPSYIEPSRLSLDAVAALLPRFLNQTDYLSKRWGGDAKCATVKEPRLGVVTFDRPEWRNAYNKQMAPAFKAAGHPVYDVFFVSVEGSTAQQLSGASSAAQSAVLKFSSDCVDHVVFMSAVAMDYLFMNVADQQNYRPRYGLSSLESPPVIIPNLANAKNQLTGSIAAGWSPYSDVEPAQFDALAKAPSAACFATLAKQRQAPTDNNSAILTLPACDGPLFLVAALKRQAQAPSGTSLVSVINAMGSAYAPSGAYRSTLSGSRHYGASAYRAVAYTSSCSCFRYTSGLFDL